MTRIVSLSTLMLFFSLAQLRAEETKPDSKPDMGKLHKQLSDTLSGATLKGSFTVLGKEDAGLKEEAYTITDARKLDTGDDWLLTARIKYGKYDVTVPLKLEIKWAGDTPVITITDFTIPGLGTFTSRVVIYNDKYAGTWTHGEVGGHLFGRIVKEETEDEGKADQKSP